MSFDNKIIKKLIDYKDLDVLSYSEVYNLYKSHINKSRVGLLSSFGSGRVLVENAKGSRIYLTNGNNILDLTGGFGVLNHGHNHPRIIKARIWAQNNNKMEVNKAFLSPALAALSFNITQLLPKSLQYAFFPNSGSESVDVALRLSFKFFKNQRNKVLYSDRAFHGKSLGPQSISNSYENTFKIPSLIKSDSFKFNDYLSLEKKIKESIKNNKTDIACVVIEPFSASTMEETSDAFLINARKLCNKYKILMIFDEVYTGFFKTGSFFNFMRVKNLSPDILCFAKSLGGGKSSIAGVVYTKEINDKCLNGIDSSNYLSSTYYGFYEECITAIEAINISIEENFYLKSKEIESFMGSLSSKINKTSKGKFKLTGKGIFWGLFLMDDLKIENSLLKLIPKKIIDDKNFIMKIYLASAINWLFEKHGILSALSFGFNPHLIISPNFAFTKKDLYELEEKLLLLVNENWIKFLPKFIHNNFVKP